MSLCRINSIVTRGETPEAASSVDADRPAFVEATTIAIGGRKQDERIGHG